MVIMDLEVFENSQSNNWLHTKTDANSNPTSVENWFEKNTPKSKYKTKETNTEENEAGKWTRKEFNFSSFKRSFHITDTVDAEKIVAEYQNGILTVALPKKEEAKAKEPKTIEIK